jgi:hypothetical protein
MKVTVTAGSIGTQNNADVMNLSALPQAAPQEESRRAGARPEPGRLAVFISHSSRDHSLAAALSDLLVRALRLEAAAVRCTSVDGHRLEAGASVSGTLRADIRDVSVFVALLTPQALASPYVLFELGARWGQEASLLPVVTSALDASALVGPLSELSFLQLAEAPQVEQLVFEIGRLLGRALEPPHSYAEMAHRLVGLATDPARSHR